MQSPAQRSSEISLRKCFSIDFLVVLNQGYKPPLYHVSVFFDMEDWTIVPSTSMIVPTLLFIHSAPHDTSYLSTVILGPRSHVSIIVTNTVVGEAVSRTSPL